MKFFEEGARGERCDRLPCGQSADRRRELNESTETSAGSGSDRGDD